MSSLFWWFGFPGVVVHELSHYIACVLTGVKVYRVKFFSLKGPAYVVHARPNFVQGFFISVAPFLFGTIFGYILLINANALISVQSILVVLFYWLAFSILYFSFPSDADVMNAFNGLIRFYEARILGAHSGIFSRFFWILTLPLVFLPMFLILGVLMVFHSSAILKTLWVLFAVLLSFGVW